MSNRKYTTRPRVYLAAPIHCCNDPAYDTALARTEALFPESEVVSSRDAFASNREWRDRWPVLLPSIATLVFITDPDGWIGRGVFTEIHDAAALGIPVLLLASDGQLRPLSSLQFVARGLRGWRQYARVVVRARTRRRGG